MCVCVCVCVCAVQNAEATDERRRGYAPPAPRSSIEKQQVALRAAVSPPSEKRETASSSAAFQSDSAEGASGVSAAVAAAAAAAAALSHQRMLMSSPALPFDRVSLACVPLGRGILEYRRHRIDKCLDTLLANQTARRAMPPTIANRGQRKMADCPSYY